MMILAAPLLRAARLVEARLAQLEERIGQGDETAWPDYLATLETAAQFDKQLAPGAHGELLNTREMAERLGVTPKALLRRKANGRITPAQQAGKLIRWRGTEVASNLWQAANAVPRCHAVCVEMFPVPEDRSP
jgi:hypothetical protein